MEEINMKKLLITLAFLAIAFSVFAQKGEIVQLETTKVFVARLDSNTYLRTIDNDRLTYPYVVFKCSGWVAADQFDSYAEARQLLKMYWEQRNKPIVIEVDLETNVDKFAKDFNHSVYIDAKE
jgi:hypothetical protein